MISTLEQFSGIIISYKINKFREYGEAYELVAVIKFVDASTLYVRDYLFSDGKRKYSYHWQESNGALIIRWDNAEHFPLLHTFPFHEHVHEEVRDSQPMTLQKVLQHIREKIAKEL